MYAKFLFLIAFFIHGMVFLIGNWKMSWKIIIQYSKVGIDHVRPKMLMFVRKYMSSNMLEMGLLSKTSSRKKSIPC